MRLRLPGRGGRVRVGTSRRRSPRRAPTAISWSRTAATSARTRSWPSALRERSHFYGYTSDVITLNELAESPPHSPGLAARGHDLHLHVEPAVERDRVQGVARAHRARRRRRWRELPVSRLGARQQPVERVPRVPPLRAQEAGRAGRGAARRLRVRRRGLARVGAPARGLERPRLARPARAVRRPADRGRGGPRRGRAGGRGRADGRRLEHRDAQVAGRRRGGAGAAAGRPGDELYLDHAAHVTGVTQAGRLGAGRAGPEPAAGAAGPDDPPQRRRDGHGRGPGRRVPGTPGARVAEAEPGTWSSACRRASPTGSATTSVCARGTTRSRSGGWPGASVPSSTACYGAEDAGRPRGAEGRRAAGPQRAHQPRRHQRPADRARCSISCSGRRPTRPSGPRLAEIRDVLQTPGGPESPCAPRSTRAATTCSGCSTSSGPAR